MPSYTGTEIGRAALREIGILDPTEDGLPEQINDAITVGTDLIDEWRTSKLTISGVTRSVYSLTSGTQTYTIGSGGAFNQDWPTRIEFWSRIPDDDATDPVEQPMGRPYTFQQWQQVRIKTQDAAYPDKMYYDGAWSAGLGNCLFHPIPDNNDVDVVLYSFIAAITALASGTTYNLRPAYAMALKTNLAVEIADRNGRDVPNSLLARARRSLASLKRHNKILRVSPIRPEFVIGQRGRAFNLYTGGR